MPQHKIDKLVKYPTDDPIYQIHEYGIDMRANHVYIMGEADYVVGGMDEEEYGEPGVEYLMANRFVKNLNILMRKSEKDILIHMKTNGGDWYEGMAMYDVIKACPNRVTILSYTHARSMSSLIFQAADWRVMMPHSTFMFHQGTFSYDGTVKQADTEHTELQRTKKEMMDIYIESMKDKGKFKDKTEAYILKWLIDQMDKREEVYMTAEQAVEYGFADEIFGANGTYDWGKLHGNGTE